jgi:2,4-dienoyl-CoA reductase
MRFNCLSPGPIETKGAFSRLDPLGKFKESSPKTIPLGRFGEVEEFANLATYMLSDYANWMTGTVVTLDGGQFPFMAGTCNNLVQVDKETWKVMEKAIRSVKGS